jgi:Effector-associated domain 7
VTNQGNQPTKPSIRQLVEEALTVEQLQNLCFDEFPAVGDQFTDGQTKDQRIRLLVNYAQRQGKTTQLLNEIKRINPNIYTEYEQELAASNQAFISSSHPATSSPKIYTNLPEHGRCSFVGREKEIEQLLKQIKSRQIIHNIHGIGGIGKTSLAIEVAHQCLEVREDKISNPNIPLFDAFIFISFKNVGYPTFNTFVPPRDITTKPLDIYQIIAKILGEDRILKLPEEEQDQASYQALSRQSTLLIVDNTETLSREDNQKVLDFLNSVPECTKVIIATKDPMQGDSPAIRLSSLGIKEVTSIIQEESEFRGVETTTDEITKIYDGVGGHALVVKNILTEKYKGNDIEDILNPETGSVKTSIEQCICKEIQSLESLAFQIFMAAIMLDNLPTKDLLLKVAGYTNRQQRVFDAKKSLSALERLCLIVKQEENDCYSIEPTTREYARLRFLSELNPAIHNSMEDRKLEYYLELTEQYGGEDWGEWKSQYALLKQEWQHIESVLEAYKKRGEWTTLFKMWERVDRYIDLSGSWQNRLNWWELIEKNTDNPRIKARALAEKAWSKILIGNTNDDYVKARTWLQKAQDNYKFDGDELIKADIANYSAIAWETENKDTSRHWLQQESEIIENSNLEIDEKIRNRYRARNLYFRAKIENDSIIAERQFREVIELCDRIDWLRFRNYAQNDLADILVNQGNLEEAEELLSTGIGFSTQMEEERRVALYHFSLAKLFWKKIEIYKPEALTGLENSGYLTNLKNSMNEAKTQFEKLGMLPELKKIEQFISKVDL